MKVELTPYLLSRRLPDSGTRVTDQRSQGACKLRAISEMVPVILYT